MTTCAARVQLLNGGDAVIGARLQGKQPVVINVRCFTATETLQLSDRAVNVRTGDVYDQFTSVNGDERRAWVNVLAVSRPGLAGG